MPLLSIILVSKTTKTISDIVLPRKGAVDLFKVIHPPVYPRILQCMLLYMKGIPKLLKFKKVSTIIESAGNPN